MGGYINRFQDRFSILIRAFLWMSITLLSFCLMAIAARELGDALSIFQVLTFRSAIGLIAVYIVMRSTGSIRAVKTKRLRLHVFRNCFHFAGQYFWFLGIILLPLAEVTALGFTIPIWTALIALIFFKKKITRERLSSIVLGIVGVIVITKPGSAMADIAALVVIMSAIFYAISHTVTGELSSSEKPITVLFYMCLIQLPIGFVLSVSSWQWPVGMQWLWLCIIGLAALSAHFCLTRAMTYADVTTIFTLDFLRLPLMAMLGALIYHEPIGLSVIIGGALMAAGNLVNIRPSRTKTSELS